MISWCTWNVQDLNEPLKSRTVLDFLSVLFVGFYCLLETRFCEDNFGVVFRWFVNLGVTLVVTVVVVLDVFGCYGNGVVSILILV